MIPESHTAGWFSEYIALLHDPAHILFEITLTIVFDFLIVYVGYKVVFKKIIIPRLRKEIHEEIDREHELTHEGSQ
jgi:hypothetical protein